MMMTVAGLIHSRHNALRDSGNGYTIQTPAEMTSCRGPYVTQRLPGASARKSAGNLFFAQAPGTRQGELVSMPKRLTSGIETSPLQRWPVDRVAFRVVQPGIHYTPNGLKTITAALEGGEAPPAVNVPFDLHDLTGMTIGQLTVVRYLGHKTEQSRKNQYSRWLVRCLCGAYENRRGTSLRRLMSSVVIGPDRCLECQNLLRLRGSGPPSNWQTAPIPTAALLPGANDIFAGGERFGRLTVVGYGKSGAGGGARWVVRCDCGRYGLMSAAGLKRGKPPQQCDGCYKAQLGDAP
jgi:hypothetical protein